VFDSIHACGCYRQFFPTARAYVFADEDMLRALPRPPRGQRP